MDNGNLFSIKIDKIERRWYKKNGILYKTSFRRMMVMLEKYETPEFEFVEVEDMDIITTSSSCDGFEYVYGDGCTGELTA